MSTIKIKQHNFVYCKIEADSGIKMELKEHLQFQVPGYKFMPAYKNGTWNG